VSEQEWALIVREGVRGPGEVDSFVTTPRRAWIIRPLSWRRNGFRLTDDVLLLRRGIIWRKLAIVPLARMQSFGVHQGPVDRALRVAGRSDAEVVVDQADATARGVAGDLLGDDELKRDASRRRTAAGERERAQNLRAAAERRSAEADAEMAEEQERAERLREQTEAQAERRREQARKERDARKREQQRAERERKEANAKAQQKVEESIEERAKRARLEQLDEEAEALEKREEALTASDEAKRLADAAGRAKAARKS
jgi:putative membrane protein